MYEMQVMPSTARDPGFGIKPVQNNSPAEFNRVGREYWRKMMERYGNFPKVFGAYNAGPGRVDQLSAKYGSDWLQHAPAETRSYVANNMERYRALRGY